MVFIFVILKSSSKIQKTTAKSDILLFFNFRYFLEKWKKWNNLRFLTHFSIFPFFLKNRKTEKWKNIYIYSHHLFILSIVFKKWKKKKNEKWHTYRLIFHNSILIRKMKKMTSVANNFSIFFNKYKTNKQTKTDNFSSFVLMKNSKEKWQIMNIYQ